MYRRFVQILLQKSFCTIEADEGRSFEVGNQVLNVPAQANVMI
jgi:hypothetical protein